MKRIQLFEFEDFGWFPDFLRVCMTRYVALIHRLLGTRKDLLALLGRALGRSKAARIVDLCSGSGGPMIDVATDLRATGAHDGLELVLTDLYPNQEAAARINGGADKGVRYLTEPVNAASLGSEQSGVRTMMCSLHHMPPGVARAIFADAQESGAPFCAYEISDNSIPIPIAALALPFNIVMVLLLTPMIRPMTWQQIVFTYLIPVLPLLTGWDGAVSNLRTYTVDDTKELLRGLDGPGYEWEVGTLGDKMKRLYVLGLPADGAESKGDNTPDATIAAHA